MKAQLLQVATTPNQSFSVRREPIPNINSRWHCHPEVELIHFHRGSGTQFIGDSIRRFSAGDVVLVGANLPHYWHYDDVAEPTDPAAPPAPDFATVVHFTEDFWGPSFLALPENSGLKTVLERARRGLALSGTVGRQVASLMEKLCQQEGTFRLIALMKCLLAASECDETSMLASLGFQYDVSEAEHERLNTIYAYTLRHYHEPIRLADIASLAGLAPNSFCRYFKNRTGKPYSRFLLEVRVGNACKLLINSSMSVKQIGYASGFNNFTCFYEKFKRITGQTPLLYQRAHRPT